MTVFNTILGTSQTRFRIGLVGPTIYTGTADPTVTPPTPIADGLKDGDVYIRTATGASALWVSDNAGVWTQIASGAGGGSFSGDIVMNPSAQFLGDDSATAGAPAYAFDGDDDTGMFQNNPDEISFATGGIERFIIESDGTLASTTAGYEALVLADNDIPNRKFTEDTYLNVAGDSMTGDLTFIGTAQAVLADGSVADPAMTFSSDTDTGLFFPGPSGNMAVTSDGEQVMTFNNDGLLANGTNQFIGSSGTVGIPSFTFNGDQDTGIFSDALGEITFTSNGTETIAFNGTTANGTLLWQGGDGAAATPALSFSGDPNTGFHRIGSGDIGYSSDGTTVMTIDGTSLDTTIPFRGPDGSGAIPTFSFTSDPDTGMYLSGTSLAFSNGSTPILLMESDGTVSVSDPTYETLVTDDNDIPNKKYVDDTFVDAAGDTMTGALTMSGAQIRANAGSAGTPGISFNGDANTGFFNSSNGIINVSNNGTDSWEFSNNILRPTVTLTNDIGTSSLRLNEIFATTFNGTATAAEYSDLAERYTVGDCCQLQAGDVVVICDHEDHDICAAEDEADDRVLGVVSTAPAFMMNKDAGDDDTAPYIALRGRVPVRVCGSVKKGDLLITCGTEGCARAVDEDEKRIISPHAVFAKALSADEDGVCEAVIL